MVRRPTASIAAPPVPTAIARARSDSPLVDFFRKLRRKPLGFAGLVLLVLLVIVALGATWLMPYPIDRSTGAYSQAPGFEHPFGTDHLGRDVLSRVMYGARVSLRVGVVAVALGAGLGSLFGLVSGYVGGWFDIVMQRLVDVMMALPGLLLVLAIMAALGASVNNVTLALAIGLIPGTTRIVRGSVLSVKERQFIEAARALGASDTRVAFRHVLPNVVAPIIVVASLQVGTVIIAEASLSFLGLGVPLNIPSWGNMLSGASINYMSNAPWMAIFPGLALTIAVLSVNLLGDAVRDILDPRLRGSGAS